MGGEQKLTGPDLAAGIALAELRDGEMLVGHAGGEAVLLARRGEEIFAVAATCTHYSGPLGEGLPADAPRPCPARPPRRPPGAAPSAPPPGPAPGPPPVLPRAARPPRGARQR